MVFYMKKFILFIFLVILCSISNNKLNATDCYNTYNFGCFQWSNIDYRTVDIVLDDFPGCTLHVNYTWRYCLTDPSLNQMRIIYYGLGSGCANVYQYLHPGGQIYVDPVKDKLLRNKIFLKITRDLFEPLKNNYPCPNYQYSVSMWDGICQAVCEIAFTDMSIGYVTNDCVTDYCCGIIVKYCYNELTGLVEKDELHIGDQNYDCWILPAPPCPQHGDPLGDKTVDNVISSSGCHSNCVFE